MPGMYAEVTVIAGDAAARGDRTADGGDLFAFMATASSSWSRRRMQIPMRRSRDLEIERRFVKLGQVRDGRVNVIEGVKPATVW